jgi:hypothetical protein
MVSWSLGECIARRGRACFCRSGGDVSGGLEDGLVLDASDRTGRGAEGQELRMKQEGAPGNAGRRRHGEEQVPPSKLREMRSQVHTSSITSFEAFGLNSNRTM